MIEGHMGTYKGQPSTMTGDAERDLAGRYVEKLAAARPGSAVPMTLNTDTLVFGAGNPAPVEQPWLRDAGNQKNDNARATTSMPQVADRHQSRRTAKSSGTSRPHHARVGTIDGVNEVVAVHQPGNGDKRWATADRNGYLLCVEPGRRCVRARPVPFVKDISLGLGS